MIGIIILKVRNYLYLVVNRISGTKFDVKYT